ncbi:MAG: hypothetical protein M0R39_05120 [Prolixibacteraceae bacterium]|nr:hypothetical protein [Prolixibacteraceae bacterium]
MVGSLCAILYFDGGFIGLHCISSYADTYRGVAPTGNICFDGGFIGLHCISSYAVTYRGVAPSGSGQNKL